MFVEYGCEVCGARYHSRGEAIDCEVKHTKYKEVVQVVYTRNQCFPDAMLVSFQNGRQAVYVRQNTEN